MTSHSEWMLDLMSLGCLRKVEQIFFIDTWDSAAFIFIFSKRKSENEKYKLGFQSTARDYKGRPSLTIKKDRTKSLLEELNFVSGAFFILLTFRKSNENSGFDSGLG